MNSKTWTRIIALALSATLAVPVWLAAQSKQNHPHQYHHYQIVDVGTFGGPQSFLADGGGISAATDMNQQGTLGGWSDTPASDPFYPYCYTTDCYVAHAFRLQNGVVTDLGTLVAGVSSDSGGGINNSGLIAGTSENGELDPLVAGAPELRSVIWENGVIRDLGTLPEGGYESYSNAINNRGQVVGNAGNTIPDANSMSSFGGQTRAFLWDKQRGMQDLGTLPGGTDAVANLINEQGQVVGWSYTGSTPSANCPFPLTTDSFIWDEKNGMKDLGTLGGTCTLATDINNRGQVVGQSNLTGDQIIHAFVWDRATGLTDLGTLGGSVSSAQTMNDHGDAVGGSLTTGDLQFDGVLWRKSEGKWQSTDLGTLEGATCTWGTSINASGQVVGNSGGCDIAFLWEDGGPMADLNTLVPPNSGLQVEFAQTINNRGEIAVGGLDTSGNSHSLLLIPCDENHPGVEGCDYSLVDPATAPISRAHAIHTPAAAGQTSSPRQMLRQRSGVGPHIPGSMTSQPR
jgi:probable HAF family extracellular repeat protein